MNVADVMTTEVLTVAPTAPLKEVAEALVGRGISGVPVVASDGVILGVVSEADILAKERGSNQRDGWLGRLLYPGAADDLKLDARSAAEAMTAPAITIRADRPVAEAAALMLDEQVNRLPVVDNAGRLAGIVTRADLVRAFTRSDDEIAREIREDVILRTLWIEPEQVLVSVSGGEVRLDGEVETKTDAQLLPAFVQKVPGVVSVDAKLRWPE